MGQIVRPLDTVAAYIPAGRYPLPSTLMMTVIPAQVAGVAEHLRGLPAAGAGDVGHGARCWAFRTVFEMGGAQAIAAFAFGTRTVPRADRIVGPGNIYVAAAKKLLAGEVGIDFVAGPTEILIIAADGDPRHLAADMLAQAEHDVDASAMLLTTSKRLATAVAKEIERQLGDAAHGRGGAQGDRARIRAIVLVRSLDEAVEISNRFAPEHLSIPDETLLPQDPACGQRVRRAVQPGGGGRLCFGPESCAAHQRRGAAAGRAFGGGLSESDFGAAIERDGACSAGAGDHHAGARRGLGSARALGGGALWAQCAVRGGHLRQLKR